jgi:glycosyltransferase involved in cell wall biosynthesis
MDQHPHSLGGVQTSVMLQKKYLNRNGVKVTIFAPKSKRMVFDPDIKVVPSSYQTFGREYSVVWSLRKAARFCQSKYESEHFDLVHLQGDFAAASLAIELAKSRNLPLVYTSHTNVDVMANKLIGKPLKIILLRFFTWQHAHFLKIAKYPKVFTAFEYMAFVHRNMDKVIAPSSHYAKLLKQKGVAGEVEVIINGVDDELLNNLKRRTPVHQKPVRFVWAGRMQPEKRLLQTIEAFARAKGKATLDVYGFGPLERAAKNLVRARRLSKRVKFHGKLPHREILQVFADADVVMQTSIGFETQGLTVYESAAVGTPTLLCDANIAAEIPGDSGWLDNSGSIKGLAKTIKLANKEISEGNTKRENLANNKWLFQSEISKKTIALYGQMIKQKASSSSPRT